MKLLTPGGGLDNEVHILCLWNISKGTAIYTYFYFFILVSYLSCYLVGITEKEFLVEVMAC